MITIPLYLQINITSRENRTPIILKTTCKSSLTFKVTYCIIRRHCSKVSNCVILQRTVMLKTFIKANTAIIVRTTLLGWLKDLALCLALHSVPSKRQGRSSKAPSTGPRLLPLRYPQLTLPSLAAPFPSPVLHAKPHKFTYIPRKRKKKSILTLGCYQLRQKTIPPSTIFYKFPSYLHQRCYNGV